MALYDLDGTVTGSASLTGTLAVSFGLTESFGGGSLVAAPLPIRYIVEASTTGSFSYQADPIVEHYFSGTATGSGDVIDLLLVDLAGIATGSSAVSAATQMIYDFAGTFQGGSALSYFYPEPVYGIGMITAYMEVLCVPPPVCATPRVPHTLRWGQQLGPGDLQICVTDAWGNPLGPVCISFTMYQVQPGNCAWRQVGPSGRKPAKGQQLGCYYATGTAGECGQPGTWVLQWKYETTFGGPSIYRDCWFQVVDSALCPVPGDTLIRSCKYGWD